MDVLTAQEITRDPNVRIHNKQAEVIFILDALGYYRSFFHLWLFDEDYKDLDRQAPDEH